MGRFTDDLPSPSRRQVLASVGSGFAGLSGLGLLPVVRRRSLPTDPPTIIGHRGSQGLGPPNTIEAIEAGLDAGVDGIELDVWRTLDDQLVLSHDAVLDWDTTGHGWIENNRWADIRGAKVEGTAPVIRFRDALEVLAPTGVEIYVELKGDETAGLTLQRAAEYDVLDRLTLISFEDDRLEPALDTGIDTALLATVPTSTFASDAAASGVDAALTHYVPHLTDRFLDKARDEGLTAGIWKLLETDHTLRDSLEIGPDVIVTNYPDRAIAAYERR